MKKILILFYILFLIPGVSFAQIIFCNIPCDNRSTVLTALKNQNIYDYFEFEEDIDLNTKCENLLTPLFLGIDLGTNFGKIVIYEDSNSKNYMLLGKVNRLRIYYDSKNTKVVFISLNVTEIKSPNTEGSYCNIIDYLSKENNYSLSRIRFSDNEIKLQYKDYTQPSFVDLSFSYKKISFPFITDQEDSEKNLQIELSIINFH